MKKKNKYERLAIDYSNGTDFTVISHQCGSCKQVFETQLFEPDYEYIIKPSVRRNCPNCGIKFKGIEYV